MKNKIIVLLLVILLFVLSFSFFLLNQKDETITHLESNTLKGTIINKTDNTVTIKDVNNAIYTFSLNEIPLFLKDTILIEYTGLLNTITKDQNVKVLEVENIISDSNQIPDTWQDNGIFKQYYQLAYEKLKSLTLAEKIGQILLVRYSDNAINDIDKYYYSGFVFYSIDFENKNESQVKEMMKNAQSKSKIPLLTAVDEEGGQVVRISNNPLLRNTPFAASSDIYEEGGLDLIKEDTEEKSAFLENLGLNLNLAPVVDVTSNPSSYIYNRTLKQNTQITSAFAKTVIETSKKSNVSYTLKHFPGYSNNTDTHNTSSISNKTLEEIRNEDLPPFISGINSGAEAILVSHNIVNSIDPNNPSSLSSNCHNLLRNDLQFTGIIITDDIAMGSLDNIDNTTVKAILAGNDLIITTNYEQSYNEITEALNNGDINESTIDRLAFRVLSWKYYKSLIVDNK